MLYAAYGSNLHPLRLSRRTPSAECLGTARVAGYRLTFDKRGRDGSGKCSVASAATRDDCVYVAVYALSDAHRLRLDAIEGLGCGYAREFLEVPGFGRCYTYVAEPGYRDARLAPYDWYRELVLLGCRRHGFPATYRGAIEAVACRVDEDGARCEENRRILGLLERDVAAAATGRGAGR